jgi:hypothetical protein
VAKIFAWDEEPDEEISGVVEMLTENYYLYLDDIVHLFYSKILDDKKGTDEWSAIYDEFNVSHALKQIKGLKQFKSEIGNRSQRGECYGT